jgi:hypothetical protein
MASDYGLNFGFRVSDETRRSSMGRVKTPATGPNLLLGSVVEIDPASAGYLRQGAANVHPRTGTCGLLVQEEIWDKPIYGPEYLDSFSLGVAYPNRLSVITNGPGTKVWYKNTVAQTRADGRAISAVTIFLTASVAVGRGLAWNGTQFVDVADPLAATSFGEVSFFDSSRSYVELILQK